MVYSSISKASGTHPLSLQSIVLVKVGVKDPMVYFTDNKDRCSIDKMLVQDFTEQGEIYVAANCLSTSDDQTGLIPDRLVCLESLTNPIDTRNGIEIAGKAVFFKWYKQAA